MSTPLKFLSAQLRMKQCLSRLRRNEDGLAAIEFAILAPLLVSMYFGLAEVASGVATDRAVSHAANVIGDLASQTSNIDREDLEDVLSATLRVMNIDDASKVTIQLDSWSRDSGGNDTLVGSAVMNSGAANLPSFDTSKIDTSIMDEKAGILVARVAYNYAPLKLLYMEQNITLSDTFVLKPRRSSTVTFGSTDGKVYSCTGSGSSVSCS
jgi:Flp pilus assembly protein TadG